MLRGGGGFTAARRRPRCSVRAARPDKGRMAKALAIAAALVCAGVCGRPAPARADDDSPGRQFLSKRVVRQFDFEERRLGNFERMPRYWFNQRGPAYPKHTADRTGFDTTHAASGKHALKLELNGGSAAAVLQQGAIAAVPGADYIVTANCRTERLTHARARLVAWFADEQGRVIDASRAASPLHLANGQWSRLELRLRGDFPDAAWIVVRVELLQQAQFLQPVLGEHDLFRQDIGGAAWFDDVTLFQLPRIEIASPSKTNLLRGPAPPLSLTVRDLTGEALRVQTVLRNHDGKLIDTQSRTLDGRHAPQWTWQPKLNGFGWYWADLTVRSGDRLVGRRTCAFAWLPPFDADGRAEAHRFGIVAERLSPPQRLALADVIERLGTGAAIVELWPAEPDTDANGRRRWLASLLDEVDPALNRLIDMEQSLTLSIAEVPKPLAELAKIDTDRPLALLAGDAARWQPYVQAAAARYGQRVNRWQFGGVDDGEAASRTRFADEYQSTRTWLARRVPDARLAVPWSAMHRVDDVARATDALTMRVPASVPPDHIAAYAESWRSDPDTGRPAVALALETLPLDGYDHQRRAADLALRLVHAWRSGCEAIYIDRPWRETPTGHGSISPDPLAAVFANAIDRLGERRFVGEMAIGQGLRCYILDSPRGGALVAWNHSSTEANPTLTLELGDRPEAVDMWGNRTPLRVRNGRHVLPLTDVPTYVEGIDAKLARFRASLRLDPAFVETSAAAHRLTLSITNPWPHAVAGKLRLTGDEGWSIQPGLIRLNIPAGHTVEQPLEVSMPIHAFAGNKALTGRLHLEADRAYDVDVTVPLEIGLRDAEYRAALRVEDGHAIVTATIINRGDKPTGYYAFAQAPGRAIQQRIIARLQPGGVITKRFTFNDASELAGAMLRVGLRQLDGPAVLTQRLDVP